MTSSPTNLEGLRLSLLKSSKRSFSIVLRFFKLPRFFSELKSTLVNTPLSLDLLISSMLSNALLIFSPISCAFLFS